jgi:glutathione S-transferase
VANPHIVYGRAMSIQFYSWPRSSGARVQWVLEELGVPYEYVQVDRAKEEHKQAAYLAINPNAKVPALVDDGVSYFESLAIILHLAERYGIERGLWPKSGQDRADATSWTVWAMVELQLYMRDYLYHGMDTPISYKPEGRSKVAAEFDFSVVTRQLKMLDNRLADREYVCRTFTLADVVVASVVRFGTMFGLKLDEYPHVTAWFARLGQRPAVAKLK